MISPFRNLLDSIGVQPTVVTGISNNDIPELTNLMLGVFGNSQMANYFVHSEIKMTNPRISLKLMIGEKLIGAFLFSDKFSDVNYYVQNSPEGFESLEDLSEYSNKKGVRGVALLLLDEYRGLGYGKLLMESSRRVLSNFDYVWGGHLKSLGNLADWMKRGRLVARSATSYISLRDLK